MKLKTNQIKTNKLILLQSTMSTSSQPPEPQPLPSPPTDGITSLSYVPQSGADSSSSSAILASSSWDGTIRLYDTKAMTNVCTQSMEAGPILSLGVDGAGQCLFTGGLDGSGMCVYL